ncbi:transposase [Streptomyces sp. NPDC020490]|uniref:transposase n=1 Tax=Streptomyces sp. NPDC020490 TaxID=3365078 RepID=UPI0037905A0C
MGRLDGPSLAHRPTANRQEQEWRPQRSSGSRYPQRAGRTPVCQVDVSLHLACDHVSAVVDWRSFLPQTWGPASPKADPDKVARRGSCGIPDDVGHVEKWQPALDMADEVPSWGSEGPLALADAGYGDAAAFRLGLNSRGPH